MCEFGALNLHLSDEIKVISLRIEVSSSKLILFLYDVGSSTLSIQNYANSKLVFDKI